MARPRFHNLEPERRRAILDAAAAEFAAHGLQDASYNRIIAACGLSKGVMYYYFDDKEDLYLTVVEDALAPVAALAETWRKPRDADDFWAQVQALYGQALEALRHKPETARLARGLVAAQAVPTVAQALQSLSARSLGWFRRVLADGQAVGAVRDDLPMDYLLKAVWGLGQASDLWMLENWTTLERLGFAKALKMALGLFRRLLEPSGRKRARPRRSPR
jgi:AcrR family transcriptional regulator